MNKHSNFESEFKYWLAHIGKLFSSFPWEDEKAYANWLAQTYFYVRHTTTMICMSAAAHGARNLDGFHQALGHLAEERGHDLLLLEDLDHLGLKIEDFTEDTETALFYQNQYYMIQNEGPVSHLGYALLLEAMCAHYGKPVLQRVIKSHGQQASKFLDVHVVADQGHSEAGLMELKSLDPKTAERVLKNVRQSAYLYECILNNAKFAASQASKAA